MARRGSNPATASVRAHGVVWRRALVIGALVVGAASPALANDEGARVFRERCNGCHGDDGKGDGPAAAALVPPPRNFRDPAFWKGRTDEQNRAVVERGKPGTMMAPFKGFLSDAEIAAVVAYLRRFAPADGANAAAGAPGSTALGGAGTAAGAPVTTGTGTR